MLAAPIPTCLWCGPEYTLVYNDAYTEILGVKKATALGRSGAEVWDELWPSVGEQFEKVRTLGEPVYFSESLLTMERLEGGASEDAWFIYSLSPLTDEAGNFLAVYNVAVEVTEKVRAREALERTRATLAESASRLQEEVARREEFAATVEQAIDFVGISDPEGNAHYVNPAGRALVGLADEEAVRKTKVIDYFTPEWQERVSGELIPKIIRDGSWRGEVLFRNFATGEEIPAEWNVFAIRASGSSEITALACVARDLREQQAVNAERLRLLREAQIARSEAEAASRAKSDFLAVMSHELRTPLNAIGGYAELLAMGIRGPVTPEQMDDLQRIQSSQRHLLGLINEVLNHARLETGAVQYEIRNVWLGDAFSVAEGLIAPQARSKGLTLSIKECAPDMRVRADADKLQQILLNLLSNAIKFTEEGNISLGCEQTDGAKDIVAIRVSDSGIGVPADKLDKIFDPFVQVDSRLTRTAEGTGLGLAISRDLARGMGGDLTATSSMGQGSTFTLTLPRAT
jgi:PAS domain S-box-containing protein